MKCKSVVAIFLLSSLASIEARADNASDVILAIPCSKTGHSDLTRALSLPSPLGIPLDLWTTDIADLVLERVKVCRGSISEVQTKAALQLLPDRLRGIVNAAENSRHSARKRRELIARQEAVEAARQESDRKARALAEERRQLAMEREEEVRRTELERRRLEQIRAEEERQLAIEREEEVRRTELERRRQEQIQRDAEAERQKVQNAELKKRLELLPSDARNYLSENPNMSQPGFGQNGSTALTMLYAAELAFRVCRERFGGNDASIKEIQRRTALIEKILIEGFLIPQEKISNTRKSIGVDGGNSQMIDYLRADRNLMKTCHEFQAMLGLSPPLR